jgi:hypothetical protein
VGTNLILRQRIRCFALVASITVVPRLSSAQGAAQPPSDATASAERLFRDARALIARKDYAAACPKLEESLRLDPAPGTEFNLARCYELDGRFASAANAYEHVADAMRAAHEAEREKVARLRAAEIGPRLSFLALTTPSPGLGADVHLALDGRELPRAASGTPIPIDHGDHTVSVTAPGKRPWQTSVHVERGVRTIPVNIPPLEDEPSPAPSEPADAPPPPASAPVIAPPEAPVASNEERPESTRPSAPASTGVGAQKVTAIGMASAALVAAGVGAYFGVRAFDLAGDVRAGCRTAACNADYSSSHTDGDISTVSFVACGALAVTGAVLWLTAPRRSPAASVPRKARIVVAPGTSFRSALVITGEF